MTTPLTIEIDPDAELELWITSGLNQDETMDAPVEIVGEAIKALREFREQADKAADAQAREAGHA